MGRANAASPVASETHIAGVYASVPDAVGGGTQRQGSINLPGWTQLDVVVAGRRYASADARRYRQLLQLRRGVVTTKASGRSAGAWRTLAPVRPVEGDVDRVSFAPRQADAVRLRLPAARQGGENPRLAELTVGP